MAPKQYSIRIYTLVCTLASKLFKAVPSIFRKHWGLGTLRLKWYPSRVGVFFFYLVNILHTIILCHRSRSFRNEICDVHGEKIQSNVVRECPVEYKGRVIYYQLGGPVIFRVGVRIFFGDVLGGLKIKWPRGRGGGHVFRQVFGGGGGVRCVPLVFHFIKSHSFWGAKPPQTRLYPITTLSFFLY